MATKTMAAKPLTTPQTAMLSLLVDKGLVIFVNEGGQTLRRFSADSRAIWPGPERVNAAAFLSALRADLIIADPKRDASYWRAYVASDEGRRRYQESRQESRQEAKGAADARPGVS